MATKTGKLVEKKPKRASKSNKRIHVAAEKQDARKTVGMTLNARPAYLPPKVVEETLPYLMIWPEPCSRYASMTPVYF